MAQQTNGDPVPLGFGGATASVGDHIAHFYRGENEMLGILGPYIAEGLRRGERCAVISSPPTADKLHTHLLCVLGHVMLRNPLHVEPRKLLKELAERS